MKVVAPTDSWPDLMLKTQEPQDKLPSLSGLIPKPSLICAPSPQLETSPERILIVSETGAGWQLLELRSVATS